MLDLKPYLRQPNVRICVQGPYTLQEEFEKLADHSAPGFKQFAGEANALWVFYDDGRVIWAAIDRSTIDVAPLKGPPCVSTAAPHLLVEENDGRMKFYLPDR